MWYQYDMRGAVKEVRFKHGEYKKVESPVFPFDASV